MPITRWKPLFARSPNWPAEVECSEFGEDQSLLRAVVNADFLLAAWFL
jgi:hypothetical protein